MNHHTCCAIALGLTHFLMHPALAQTQVETGLLAIQDLSQVNGQALACQDLQAASRAKALMLAHAPKTARFGSAFEDGTHQAYLAQTRQTTPCPDSASLTLRMDALALRLQTSLPAAAASAAPTSTP